MWFKKRKEKIVIDVPKEMSLEEFIKEKEQIIRSIIKDMIEQKNDYVQMYFEFYNIPFNLDLNISIFKLLKKLHLHSNGPEKKQYDNKMYYNCNITGKTDIIYDCKPIVISISFIRDRISLNTCAPMPRSGYEITYVEQDGKLTKIRGVQWIS